MSGLKILTMMQLKDKIDMSFLKSTKKTIFKVVLSVIKFAIITALIWVAFFILDYLNLVSLIPGIPQEFFTIVFSLMITLSVIVCVYGLMKSLYFGKDNQLLLTLPASKSVVFTSKLLVYYFYELIRNLFYMLPLIVAYGIINSLPIYFWLWLVPAYFVLTAIPVVLGALLSIPAMLITVFLKNNKWLQYPIVIAGIAGLVWIVLSLISIIPANFDLFGSWGTTFWEIQAFMKDFGETFMPLTYLVIFVVGERYGIRNRLFTAPQMLTFAGIIAGIIVVMGVTYLIVRPVYYKMASVPFEFKKSKVNKLFVNRKHSPVASIIRKERLLLFRDSEKLFSLITIAIALPILIFLLNKIFAAMDTMLTGANMAIAFNLLLILLISLSSNARLSYIYSEEGASSYLGKTSPQPYLKLLFSKLIINIVVMTISIAVTSGIFAYFQGYTIIKGIEVFVLIELLYISHMLMSAELDIMNPQTAHYQTTGGHSSNPNETRSTILGFILSGLFAFLTYFFIAENNKSVWIKLIVFAGILFAIRIWLYINKIKVYYKEK